MNRLLRSNAKAIIDLGLAELGYTYVTTHCAWTLAERNVDGTLAWNAIIFQMACKLLENTSILSV